MAVKRTGRRGAKATSGGKGLGGGSVERKLANRYKKTPFVKFEDKEPIFIRVVDTNKGFKELFVHRNVEVEVPNGNTFEKDVICLDQENEGEPCPGCRDGIDRALKYWFIVIERESGAKGQDEAKLLSGTSARLLTALNAKQKRQDLALQDVEIVRTGKKFETQYEVEWVDDADDPVTDDEIEMTKKAGLWDTLKKYTTPTGFDDFYVVEGNDDDDDDEDKGEKSKRRGASFKGTKKSRRAVEEDEDEDEDDEDEEPPRRAVRKKKSGGLAAKKSQATAAPKLRRRR